MWIWIIITSGYILASMVAYMYADMYIAELWISFLPYWMWLGCGLSILVFFFFLKCVVGKKKWWNIIIRGLLLVLLVSSTGRYISKYTAFYTKSHITDAHINQQGTAGLTFLYANIRYKNQDTDELYDLIMDRNPDIMFLVEYTPTHHEELYDRLSAIYPYTNIEYPDNGPAGKVVYAKYPFKNLAPTLGGSATWKYGYISMEYKTQEYIFYLIHTSAPISPHFFSMRNRQLSTLEDDITAHVDGTHYASIVNIIGDFNVTPRSPAYQRLADVWYYFENVTRTAPGITTWSLPGWGIRAHIDHIRTNMPHLRGYLERIPLAGSDHDALYGKILYKNDK